MNLTEIKDNSEEQYLEALTLFNQAIVNKNLFEFRKTLPIIESYLKNNAKLTQPELKTLFHGKWNEDSYFIFKEFKETLYHYVNDEDKVYDLRSFLYYINKNFMMVNAKESSLILEQLLSEQKFSEKWVRDKLLNVLYDSNQSEFLTLLTDNQHFMSDVSYYQCSLWHIIANFHSHEKALKFFNTLFSHSEENMKRALTENNEYGRSFVDFAYYSNVSFAFFRQLVELGNRFMEDELQELDKVEHELKCIKFYKTYLIKEEKKQLESVIVESKLGETKIKI